MPSATQVPWTVLSEQRTKPGPKGPSERIINAIVELKRRNRRFGCPRIALIISTTFVVEIDKHVVRRVLAKHYHPESGGDGPSWLTFFGHMKHSLWRVDLFRCESIFFVQDPLGIGGNGSVHPPPHRFGVHAVDVDAMALCRMFNRIISGEELPRPLCSDQVSLFEYRRWQATLRILDMDPIKSVPDTPLYHPFVEHLIGTIRRAFLDQTLFWNVVDLEERLGVFKEYYSHSRVHASLKRVTPAQFSGEPKTNLADLEHYRWQTHWYGLVQLPLAA